MILVTGGAGFIGSHIVDTLVSNNFEVIVIDNLSSGKMENLNPKCIFCELDIKNYDSVYKVFNKYNIDYVIHLAAQVSVSYSIKHPIEDASENIMATLNIIKISNLYNVKKIIASSSAAVYGTPDYLPVDENHKISAISNYGLSKITMEEYIKLSGINYILLRFSNVYGPRQTPHGEAGVVSIFINNALSEKTLNILGDGEQTRDFIYVLDIANACCNLLKNDISKEIINVSTGNAMSINELYKKINKVFNNCINVVYKEERSGDIKHSVLDNKKMIELTKITTTELDIGLEKTVAYFKANS